MTKINFGLNSLVDTRSYYSCLNPNQIRKYGVSIHPYQLYWFDSVEIWIASLGGSC
jgi:hypothetical protein